MLRSRAVTTRISRTIATIAAAVVVGAGLAACGGGGDASLGPDADAAVRVGSATITNGDIERRAVFLATAPDPTTGAPAEPPAKDSEDFRGFRLSAADQLVDERVFGILAAQCGAPCRVTNKELDAQVKELTDQSFRGSTAELKKALEERGITLADYRSSLRAATQEERLTAKVESEVTFTEAQARAYYAANRAQYKLASEKRLSHVLLPSKAEAEALRAELTPENFADLARERSTDPAAKETGGDLGAVNGSGLIPEIAAAAQTLKPGQISKPVQSQFGWHLLLVRDVKARTKSFDEVRDDIVQQQLQVAQAAAVQKWRDTVFAKRKAVAKYLNDKVAPATPVATTPAPTTSTAKPATTTATPRTSTTKGATTGTSTSGAATP